MILRLRILARWAAFRLGLRPANGLRKFHLAWSRRHAFLFADSAKGIPVLLASTNSSHPHWFGEISPNIIHPKDPEK